MKMQRKHMFFAILVTFFLIGIIVIFIKIPWQGKNPEESRAAASTVRTLLASKLIPTSSAQGTENPAKPTAENPAGKPFPYVTGTAEYQAFPFPIPARGVVIQDPDFHTSLERITDKTDGYSGPGCQNEYARTDPENSDGTRAILRGNDGTWYLYNVTDWKLLKRFDDIAGGQEPEPRWDPVDPDVFFTVHGTSLRRYSAGTGKFTVVRDFKKEFPKAAYITTKTEGDASVDRRWWAFMVQDADYKLLSVIVYDREANKIAGRKDTGFLDDVDWVSMDMSGTHCIIGYSDSDTDNDERTPPFHVFTRDFGKAVSCPEGANGHADLARTTAGKDVIVYQNNSTDRIAMADLETGAETNLPEIPFDVNPDIGLHFSGNCDRIPGWVLVSTYNSKEPPPDKRHSWMDNQLFMVSLQEKPVIWRVAHTHSYTSKEYSGEKNYFAESFAAINRAGSRVYFGSNWERFTPEYSDTFVIHLPKNWQEEIEKRQIR